MHKAMVLHLIKVAKDFLDVYSRKTVGGMKLKIQPSDLNEISSKNTLKHTG